MQRIRENLRCKLAHIHLTERESSAFDILNALDTSEPSTLALPAHWHAVSMIRAQIDGERWREINQKRRK